MSDWSEHVIAARKALATAEAAATLQKYGEALDACHTLYVATMMLTHALDNDEKLHAAARDPAGVISGTEREKQ